MEGWIKLHRKILESPIFSSEKGLKVWIWCLLKASHQGNEFYLGLNKIEVGEGQFVFGRDSASTDLKMSPSTVWNWMRLLRKDSYLNIKTTNKYSVITICNWKQYQLLDNKMDSRITTEKQQNNTNNNVENVKKIIPSVLDDTRQKEGNVEIDKIINSYKKNMGFSPTDKKPRFVAQVLRGNIHTFLKTLNGSRPELNFDSVLDKTWKWYMNRDQMKGDTLDVFRRKAKMLFDVTITKGGEIK